MVLADSREHAEDALSMIALDIDPLPPVLGAVQAKTGEVKLFDCDTGNCASVFNATKGNTEEAFRAAHHIQRGAFRVQRMTALPMETRGLLAEWDERDQRLTMSGAAKLPFFNKRAMATTMKLPEEAVDYIEYDVGGGFGARGEFYPEDYLVAFAARRFGCPVKWIEDRREHLSAIAHSRETDCDLEYAFDKDGILLGIRGVVDVDIGAYVRPNGMTPVRNAVQFLSGPYRVPNIRLEARAYVSNKTPSGTYRGPGRFEGCFFTERMLELAARELKLDPVEIRRRNLVALREMPYPLASVVPNDGFGVTQCDSGDYSSTFAHCLDEAGWGEKAALQGKLIDGRYHGLGLACFIEGGGSGPRENARMAVDNVGIAVYVGSSAIGQGIETIFAQIAADVIELPIAHFRVLHGSTNYLREGWGSYGSRATVMGGSAVLVAAQTLLENFRAAAAKQLDVAPETLTIAEGRATVPDGRQVALLDCVGLKADGTFSNNSKATYTYGTAVAHVAVDAKTGHVEVVDYVVVDDVGRIINALTLHGQVVGAAVQGLGSVFSEEIAYDANGQLLSGSLADYLIPVATDYPVVRAISLEQHPSPNNPLGAKGAGEGGIIPVGGAIANAVSNALGSLNVEVSELPLTPPRLWQLIHANAPA
jgi:carbon-monoxide dehydrogenase large subunit